MEISLKRGSKFRGPLLYYECPAGEHLPKKTQSNKQRHWLYTSEACTNCHIKARCTAAKQRWVTRHFEEDVLNEVADRTAANPLMMQRRKGGRFLVRGIQKVKAKMALAVTAYNLTRAINILGTKQLCKALAI